MCRATVERALTNEPRLARLTVVSQACGSLLDDELRALADEQRVVLSEIVLPERIGAAGARDVGAGEGDEEFIAFLDDDIAFDQGSLSALASCCDRLDLGGASGVVTNSPENTPLYRLAKDVLFRSIFRDPRQKAVVASGPTPSPVLSGGVTVYRRALYERCAGSQRHFAGYTWGEDFELSFCISRRASLVLDPTVRVRNEERGISLGRSDATEVAVRRLDRYRAFADRHASRRRHWLAYLGVLAAVLAVSLAHGAGRPLVRAVAADARRALAMALGPSFHRSRALPAAADPSEGVSSATVGAVIVYFHSEDTVLDCVRSLLGQSRLPDTIVVVANSPVPGEVLAELGNLGVRVVQNEENRGFAGACNIGAATSPCDYLWFVNPDVRCHHRCLEQLLAYAPDRAAVAPSLVQPGGRQERSTKSSSYLRGWVLLAREAGLGRKLHLGSPTPPTTPANVDVVSGACLLVSRPAFDEVGGFDERFFLYGEDVDLCLRLQRMGGDVGFVPTATASHATGTGSGIQSAPGTMQIKGREARRSHFLLLQRFRSQREADRYLRGLVWLLRARLPVARIVSAAAWERDSAAYRWAVEQRRQEEPSPPSAGQHTSQILGARAQDWRSSCRSSRW